MNVLIATDDAATKRATTELMLTIRADLMLHHVTAASELRGRLERHSFDAAFVDPGLPGFVQPDEAARLAAWYPETRFFALGGVPAPMAARPSSPLDILLRDVAAVAQPAPPVRGLTARQKDVMELLRRGCPTKEIARSLGLSVPTVKTHLAALYRQLGVVNRVQAVMQAQTPAPPRPAAAHPRTGLLQHAD
jgi:DNA-binding CsgD family transcriptional regulator